MCECIDCLFFDDCSVAEKQQSLNGSLCYGFSDIDSEIEYLDRCENSDSWCEMSYNRYSEGLLDFVEMEE
jgi:hypothetical protein